MHVDNSTASRILIINPNTSQAMTDALKPIVDSLAFDARYTYFTCPAPGIPSINSPADAAESAAICLPHLLPLLLEYDAFLVACYSHHPLVHELKARLRAAGSVGRCVIGIFEASVTVSLGLLPVLGGDDADAGASEAFGIVSTGKVWEKALGEAVCGMFGAEKISRYAGCETTGLTAGELHELPPEEVQRKMKEATKRLIRRNQGAGGKVRAICLGCAGMAGLDSTVREACIEELGNELGSTVKIVDGVKAGVGLLMVFLRGQF